MKKKKIPIKKIGRIALLVLVGLIIGLRLYVWNAETLAGNAMPMPFGIGASVVLSGSMEPTLSVDDLVIVREADGYEVGDVVVYQSGPSLVIHRIISMEEGVVVTQGDDNNTPDDPIKPEYIKGKMVGHIPFVGVIVRFLKTPVGFLLIVLAAAALFEVPYLMERKRRDEEQEKIKEEIRRLKDGK